MKARIYSDGYSLRVDMGNTGKNWPEVSHPGFPFLAKWTESHSARDAAEKWAIDHGATEIIHDVEV